MSLWTTAVFAGDGSLLNGTTEYALYGLIGILFSVLFWVVRRWAKRQDDREDKITQALSNLSDVVGKLTIETRLDRQASKQYSKDINILKKRSNRFQDWINKHVLLHAKCPECPGTSDTI